MNMLDRYALWLLAFYLTCCAGAVITALLFGIFGGSVSLFGLFAVPAAAINAAMLLFYAVQSIHDALVEPENRCFES